MFVKGLNRRVCVCIFVASLFVYVSTYSSHADRYLQDVVFGFNTPFFFNFGTNQLRNCALLPVTPIATGRESFGAVLD